jgi:general secretion pathway protein A
VYLKHFKLERKPFDQLPDPDFLYLAEQHEEALSRMQFAVAINDSFTIITGEIGSGKTTLVRKLLSDLTDECTPAFITHTRLNAIELLQMILVQLGVKPFKMGKSEMLTELQGIVDSERDNGRRVVIVVDEGQNFSIELLEELRLLTCMDTNESKSINIVLIGQPQLSTTLRSPDLDQLRQRCRLRFHLNALSENETVEYIRHRLTVADGDPGAIFDGEALEAVYGFTRGIPRLINTICDTAMIMAFIGERDQVTMESIDDAVKELYWLDEPPTNDELVQDKLEPSVAAHLTISQNGRMYREYVLDLPSYIIGRSDDCSIAIHSRYFSRHHALLARDVEGWMILDLKSTNGISVNGRDVQSWRLRSNDVIEIGEYRMNLTFKDPNENPLGPAQDHTERVTDLPNLA